MRWSRSGKRPRNIPSNPDKKYGGKGWVSWPDWMGYIGRTGAKASTFLPFKAARLVARGLGLKGWKEWEEWKKSGDRPLDIPSAPDQVYRGKGWVSWPDWLGYSATKRKAISGIRKRKRKRRRKNDEDEALANVLASLLHESHLYRKIRQLKLQVKTLTKQTRSNAYVIL